jgi:hypothetical protein
VGSRTSLLWVAAWCFSACTCRSGVDGLRFSCESDADCARGSSCRRNECRLDSVPFEECIDADGVALPDGSPCDDREACSTDDTCSGGTCAGTAPTTFPDVDGDGVGATTGETVCPVPAGNLTSGSDCDDSNPALTREVSGLREDVDHDGYTAGSAASFCVGDTTSDNGRTYYLGASGSYTLTTSNLGTDCDPNNAALYRNQGALVQDNDQDGYPPNNNQRTECVGQSVDVSGRTYYSNGSGGFWMPVASCINKNGGGTQCQAPYDSDDANGAVH